MKRIEEVLTPKSQELSDHKKLYHEEVVSIDTVRTI